MPLCRLSQELTHLEAEIFIADQSQAQAVHRMVKDYTDNEPTVLRVVDGVVDSSMSLKQQVPIPITDIQEHCPDELGKRGRGAWTPAVYSGPQCSWVLYL